MSTDKLMGYVSSNAAGLALCGVAAFARGMSYTPILVNQDRKAVHYLEMMLPPAWWGTIWITIGVLCVASVWCRKLAPLAAGLCVGIHASWGCSFMAVQILDEGNSRAWVSAISYWLVCALMIWGFSRRRPIRVEIVGR